MTAEARDRIAAWTSEALLAEVSPVSARNEAISVNGAAPSESNETSALPAVDHPEPLTASPSKLQQEEPPGRPSASPVEAWLERTDVSERVPEPAVRHSSPEPASNPVSRPRPFTGESSNGVTSRVHTGLLAASAQESSAYSAPVESPAAPAAPVPALASSSVAFSSASTETREQEIPPPPRSSFSRVDRGTAPVSPSFVRKSQTSAPAGRWWDALTQPDAELAGQPALTSQILKIGVGAAAGATLVLALVAAVPSLRTRVQTTPSTKSSQAPAAGAPEFTVEVADLNNRRWSLRSGGEGGSPFADALSRREGEPNSSLRNRDSKSVSRSNEISDRADSGTVAETRQRRTAKTRELALNRPLKTEPAGSQVQPIAPSIFDGITPPIGSSTNRFPLVDPNVPGPVAPQSESNARLQAAVLVQRVAPLYPDVAKQNRLEGDIRVSATIGKDGVPTNLNVISGNPILVPAALAAIRQWRYRPAALDGEPVETSTTVSVSFQLNR